VYDPVTGRFLQTDPVGYKADLDLYAYTNEDAMNNVDPNGQASVNFFYPDILGFNEDTWWDVAESFNPRGYFTIFGHGNIDENGRGYIGDHKEIPNNGTRHPTYHANELGKYIEAHGYKRGGGMPILLAACQPGGQGGLAHDLAKREGATVIAPNGFVSPSQSLFGGDITLTVNSREDGKGAMRTFEVYGPNGDTGIQLNSIKYNTSTGQLSADGTRYDTSSRILEHVHCDNNGCR
jgi:hypothetical protein